ncbi:MAG TPA: hypothetical protein VFZ18_00265, partial [Longimicrobiaceae bacterium]
MSPRPRPRRPAAAEPAPSGDPVLVRVEEWFAARGWTPFAYQREVWAAYEAGESGLVHAATGTGKTLAAWMGPVIEYLHEREGAADAKRPSVRSRAAATDEASTADTATSPAKQPTAAGARAARGGTAPATGVAGTPGKAGEPRRPAPRGRAGAPPLRVL